MLKRSENGRGVFYTRDSGGEHETTPSEYVRWAHRRAGGLSVTFNCNPEQIEVMIRNGKSHDGDLFLDYGVKGNQLQRSGLDALYRVALTDPGVTHVFIPRRDRFARPDDPLDAMRMEAQLREAGLTLVFMDKILPPLPRGRRDLGESIVAMIDYDRAGSERRDLAQKMIYAQLNLAKAGFSTGGRPPFGFRRWLVQGDGTPVRQLVDGEYVQRAGHHVVWLPGPDEELSLIQRILVMLETIPASRVAAQLTVEGIRTPDAGRLRTDNGVKHPTSGVWHQQTVTNIARNSLLRAIVEYGRRSMGDRLRFSSEGPRELEQADRRDDGQPKVIANPPSTRVQAPARFDALVETERHRRLLDTLDQRGGTQRGKSRSQDPARNPLGGRIFDLGCGWPMYRQPYNKSFRYLCGLYQQSHGAKCKHNCIDGMLATRFMLGCVRQRLLALPRRAKLEQKLRAIAERELGERGPNAALTTMRVTLASVRGKRQRAGENLALAEGPEQFRAVATVYEQMKQQEQHLEAEVRKLEQAADKFYDAEAEVAAAMSGLDRMVEFASAAHDLFSVGHLFQRLNARLFLRFTEARWKTRTVIKLTSGVVTLGATPAPVALYEGPTGRRHVKDPAIPEGVAGPGSQESPGVPGTVSDGERDSLGNVNRAERI